MPPPAGLLWAESRCVHDRQVDRVEDAVGEKSIGSGCRIRAERGAGVVDAVVLDGVAVRPSRQANCGLGRPYVIALD